MSTTPITAVPDTPPLESQEKFEARVALLTAKHNLRHAQGNACAFTLKAKLSRNDDERADNLGCVAYWENQAILHQARINELNRIIGCHY